MNKNTYEFTKERYDEFIKKKKDNDIVISLGEFLILIIIKLVWN